jgi:O-6-methylguanine DNA methyltransferase
MSSAVKKKTVCGVEMETGGGGLSSVTLPRNPPEGFDEHALRRVETELSKHKIQFTGSTDFQQRVWRQLVKIPKGRVTTYAQIAKALGKPRASRAVGNACGANPFPIVVPCHRVVASNGGLGGFSSGLAWKRKLLALEGWNGAR